MAKKTGAGELTEWLTILKPVLSDDGQGGQSESLSTLAEVWGQMIPLSASELLEARSVNSTQSYTARIRYRGDVTPLMRVSWVPYLWTSTKTLEIHGVLPDKNEPRVFLLLDLGEVVAV